MATYHLNPNTKKPGRCYAKSSENCKFNNQSDVENEHYGTKEEAQAASEKALEKTFKTGLSKKVLQAKKPNREEQIGIIKETVQELGFKDRHKQLETMLNKKETYTSINKHGIEFSDRNNGIKYIFYPNIDKRTIEKVQILKNGWTEETEEELQQIENELNRKIQQ